MDNEVLEILKSMQKDIKSIKSDINNLYNQFEDLNMRVKGRNVINDIINSKIDYATLEVVEELVGKHEMEIKMIKNKLSHKEKNEG